MNRRLLFGDVEWRENATVLCFLGLLQMLAEVMIREEGWDGLFLFLLLLVRLCAAQ